MLRRLPLLLLALLATAAVTVSPVSPAAFAEEWTIGTQGAKLESEQAWKRKKFMPDVGDDQFILASGGPMMMFIIEEKTYLEGEQDLRDALTLAMKLISVPVRPRGDIAYQRREGFGHAHVELDATLGTVEFTYSLHVLTRDGLKYTIAAWAPRSRADVLAKEIQKVVEGFSFPEPNSEWDKQTSPRPVAVQFRDHELTFHVRPSVLAKKDEPGFLAYYMSSDNRHAIFVHGIDGSSRRLDQQIDSIVETINEGEASPFKVVSREDFAVGDFRGRLAICDDGVYTARIAVVPVADNALLDIRYIHTGKADAPRFDRDEFYRSLALRKLDTAIELPAYRPAIDAPYRNAHQQAIDANSKSLASVSMSSIQEVQPAGDGAYLCVDGQRVVLTGPENQTLYTADSWLPSASVARHQDRWLLASTEGPVIDLATGEPLSPELNARLLATAGDRLLVVTASEAAVQLPGFATSNEGPDVLELLAADGTRTPVATLADHRLHHLVVSPDGRQALAAGVSSASMSESEYQSGYELLAIDVATGKHRGIGRWESIDTLRPTSHGWLVTGRPEARCAGIYRVTSAGRADLVLSDPEVHSVDLTSEHLDYAKVEQTGGEWLVKVERIQLRDLAKNGPRCQPFCASNINQVAKAWVVESKATTTPPNSIDEIASLIATASKVCERELGWPLPTEPGGINQLCDALMYSDSLCPDASYLMSIMVTNSLLTSGAKWVPCDDPAAWLWTTAAAFDASDPFGVGYTPASIFTGTFHDSEGYWEPATSLIEQADGRTLWIGVDAERVRAAMAEARKANDDVLTRLEPAQAVHSLIEAAPGNVFLRRTVYDRLIAAGKLDLLREIATPLAQRDEAELLDQRALLALRAARCDTTEDAEQLASDLQQLISKHPDDASLYLMLGVAFGQLDPAPSPRSRACYQRVLEMQDWGSLGEDAQKRLEALEKE